MCSSARNSTSFPFTLIVTGTTSSWKAHASHACFARCCDRTATSSTSLRVSLYFSARLSAVSAMESPHCGSFRDSHSKSSSGAGPRRRRAQLDGRQVLHRAAEGPESRPYTRQEDDVFGGALGFHERNSIISGRNMSLQSVRR